MNFDIPIPAQILPDQYALLVSDEKVDLVKWKSGVIDIIGSYSNDQAGLSDFKTFLDQNKSYEGKSFRILLNIVGEDYRYELTPHLLGRYKANFLEKRRQAIYRGASYTQSITLGREELGKRQDMTLFVGVLTEDKVSPWVRQLARHDILLIGIYSQALALKGLLKSLDLMKKHAVITVFTGGNSIRQCYFHQGQLRHSRVTKLPKTDSPQVLMKAVSAESDRFQQYLTQLKVARGVRLEFRVIVPPSELQDFQKGFKSVAGDKADHYFFYDGEQVSRLAGIKKPLVEWGRDNSLGIHYMLKTLNFQSLAPFDSVRYYWLRLATLLMTSGAGLYALYLIGIELLGVSQVYFNYQRENQSLSVDVAQLKSTYQDQVAGFVTPPSTPANMRAVSNIFSYSTYDQINPSPLLYYVSKAIQLNPSLVDLKNIDWYLTDEENGNSPKDLSYLTGTDLYQVVVLSGSFFERRNQTLEDALANVDRFLSGFDKRQDIEVILEQGPKPLDTSAAVSGTATLNDSVVSASALTSLNFVVRIIWKQRNAEFYGDAIDLASTDA